MSTELYDICPTEGLDPQVGLMLQMLDATTEEWREELGDVSEEALVWQPAAQGHSIGAILLHIADVEAYWLYEVAAGKARPQEEVKRLLSEATDQYGGSWPIPPFAPLAWYLEQGNAIRARTHNTLREMHDPERISHRVSRNREQTFTLRWLLHHVMVHEAYHGGQAVLLALQYAARNAK